MFQSYSPPTRTQASLEESHLHDVQRSYITQKNKLLNALDASRSLLSELRVFNKDTWVIRYPQFRDRTDTSAPESIPGPRRRSIRRSLSFADEPQVETEVVITPFGSRSGSSAVRSLTDVCEEECEELDSEGSMRLIPQSEASDLQLLRLDLKLGSHSSSSSALALVSQLERTSISNLIDEKLGIAELHVDKLRVRVEDTSSKVLVTGDLNAGKSTFVNALLQRGVMPVDQQPCTSAFCEVHDFMENGGVEEVHIVTDTTKYNVRDDSTFARLSLPDLEQFVSENESTGLVLKLYLQDSREPSISLINNGVADISLIDAPGLNRDTSKTTALFARQEEIDVIVFVVSAENHFTLSAKEFLTTASNEKAYIFIVVNKFEHIKNKEKCRRIILEQIKEFSPRTYEEADDLVHFVDSISGIDSAAFEMLEASLRSFVLVKRAKSKLHPASTYLSHLLADVDLLAGANRLFAEQDLENARNDIDRVRPVFEKMKACRELLEDGLEQIEEESARAASLRTQQVLTDAIDRVSKGFSGVASVTLPEYPGIYRLWDYVREVRHTLLLSLDMAVKAAEDDARLTTTEGITRVGTLEDEHLPVGAERWNRVFMPEAMFSARTRGGRGRNSRRNSTVVAGGTLGLGLGLAARQDLLEHTISDIFDALRFFHIYFTAEKEDTSRDDAIASPTAIGVLSVGLGALTMIGGQVISARAVIEGAVRVSELLGDENARPWIAPLVIASTVGAATYFVFTLPSTIPRTVGRRIRRQIAAEQEDFIAAHENRISRETRKVLRLVTWNLRERFRTAMEEYGKEVRSAEDIASKAGAAVERFVQFERRAASVREEARLVELS